MKLELPAVDRLVDSLENAHERPVPVMVHRIVLVPDAWLALTLTLIAAGLCGIAWAMSDEGGQRGTRK
jgi:hypothetical protein